MIGEALRFSQITSPRGGLRYLMRCADITDMIFQKLVPLFDENMDLRIFGPQELLQATVKMPLSKSESARALVVSALTPNAAELPPLADCDDTRALAQALTTDRGIVDVGAAGTAMRFLTAYYAVREGSDVIITGSERMLERPIGILVDALRSCGADIEYCGREGFPPLHICGRKLKGGVISVDASVSSQFVSALMMIAPLMEGGLVLDLEGRVSSAPYITLTADIMRQGDASVEVAPLTVTVAEGAYRPEPLKVGGDWSAASYWYEIEALTSGFLTLAGLDSRSLQADRSVANLFAQLGVVTEESEELSGAIDLSGSPDPSPRLVADFATTPDLVQTAVVTCVMLGLPFRICGVESLRIKETDRIAALQQEMLKLGVVVKADEPGVMEWDGSRRPITELPCFDTYSDHRMAMALAPVACYIPGIVIRDAEVVSKSYPDFFDRLGDAGFLVVDAAMPAEEVEKLLTDRMTGNADDEEGEAL